MTIYKKSNVIFDDYPNDTELSLDLPALPDDGLTMPATDSFFSFRAAPSPRKSARKGASGFQAVSRRLHSFLEYAGLLLAVILGVGLPVLAFYVMG